MKAFLAFLATHRNELLARTLEHIELVALSLLAAVAIGVPLAVMLRRNRTLAASFVGLASVVQTIPSIALLSLMLPLFGLGRNSAVAALFLYALLPSFATPSSVSPAFLPPSSKPRAAWA
jgi:osmoprotectant transport system permease protein